MATPTVLHGRNRFEMIWRLSPSNRESNDFYGFVQQVCGDSDYIILSFG